MSSVFPKFSKYRKLTWLTIAYKKKQKTKTQVSKHSPITKTVTNKQLSICPSWDFLALNSKHPLYISLQSYKYTIIIYYFPLAFIFTSYFWATLWGSWPREFSALFWLLGNSADLSTVHSKQEFYWHFQQLTLKFCKQNFKLFQMLSMSTGSHWQCHCHLPLCIWGSVILLP